MSDIILEIKHLKKSYGQNEVLKDISLTVHSGAKLSLSLEALVAENQLSFALSISSKNQVAVKYFTVEKMC